VVLPARVKIGRSPRQAVPVERQVLYPHLPASRLLLPAQEEAACQITDTGIGGAGVGCVDTPAAVQWQTANISWTTQRVQPALGDIQPVFHGFFPFPEPVAG